MSLNQAIALLLSLYAPVLPEKVALGEVFSFSYSPQLIRLLISQALADGVLLTEEAEMLLYQASF